MANKTALDHYGNELIGTPYGAIDQYGNELLFPVVMESSGTTPGENPEAPTEGLIAYWPFKNNMIDVIGNRQFVSWPTSQTTDGGIGSQGLAIYGGPNGYAIDSPINSNQEFTLTFQFFSFGFNGKHRLSSIDNGEENALEFIRIWDNGITIANIKVTQYGWSGLTMDSLTPYQQIHTASVTKDADGIVRGYFDGQMYVFNSNFANVWNETYKLLLGVKQAGGDQEDRSTYFRHYRVYNRALSYEELQKVWQADLPKSSLGTVDGLIAYWPFFNNGKNLVDSSNDMKIDTVGNSMFFNSGLYNPGSYSGASASCPVNLSMPWTMAFNIAWNSRAQQLFVQMGFHLLNVWDGWLRCGENRLVEFSNYKLRKPYHIIIDHDGAGNYTIYIDNQSIGTSQDNAGAAEKVILFGGWPESAGSRVNAIMNQLRFYDHQLTADERTAVFNNDTTINPF